MQSQPDLELFESSFYSLGLLKIEYTSAPPDEIPRNIPTYWSYADTKTEKDVSVFHNDEYVGIYSQPIDTLNLTIVCQILDSNSEQRGFIFTTNPYFDPGDPWAQKHERDSPGFYEKTDAPNRCKEKCPEL